MSSIRLCLCLLSLVPLSVAAQDSFISRWQARATRAQSEQPHWVTPLATVTPRLEQEFRTDFLRETTPTVAHIWIYDNGKGLELIPTTRTEFLFNLPPFVTHSTPASKDGAGDVSFLGKYRIFAGNEEHGNYILTAFLGGSIPTGSYTNGAQEPAISPTLAGGKGIGRFDVQSTLGATLPTARGPVQSPHRLEHSRPVQGRRWRSRYPHSLRLARSGIQRDLLQGRPQRWQIAGIRNAWCNCPFSATKTTRPGLRVRRSDRHLDVPQLQSRLALHGAHAVLTVTVPTPAPQPSPDSAAHPHSRPAAPR